MSNNKGKHHNDNKKDKILKEKNTYNNNKNDNQETMIINNIELNKIKNNEFPNKKRMEDDKMKNNKKGSKKKNKKQTKFKKVLKIFFTIIALFIIAIVGVFAGAFFGLFGDDFKISKEDLTVNNMNATLYDKDDQLIAEISKDEKRKVITINEMSSYLPNAFVAIEDERFYKHHGVDVKRTTAATATYIFNKGNSSFGGSTITQQLVKNLTNDKDRSGLNGILRKVKEMSKARQVEKMLSKEQILELYLNLIGLGGQAYGVEMASQYYFSKSASELSLAECAFLAGINNSPSLYKPFSSDSAHVEKIKTRTTTVLNKMKELGYIESEEEFETAKQEVENGLNFNKGNISSTTGHSYHTTAAIQQIKNELMEKNGWSEEYAEMQVYTKGYKIYTTQDSEIQSRMEEEFLKDKYIVKSSKTKNEDTGEYEHTQAAMVIIDHTNGEVVGTVGGLGEDSYTYGLNRATQSTRQTGSAMKPISVIAPAIEEKIITAGTVYDDCETSFGSYKPKNYYSGYKGLSTVRSAIEISQNIIPLKIMAELTPQKSIEYLKKMGVSSIVTANENRKVNDEGIVLALGGLTNGVSPLEMAAAYATIANDGEYIEPTFYRKVEDGNGNIILESNQEKTKVLSDQAAYITKSILKQPVEGSNGTATYCAIKGMDICAKTGTTNDDYDRWLCEFSPYYTSATWFGYDVNESVRYSGNPAGKISSAIFEDIHKSLENKTFNKPNGITSVSISKTTGLLSSGGDAYMEEFIEGTEPTENSSGSSKLNICTESNLIATEFCPNIEEKGYSKMPIKEETFNGKLWESSYGSKYSEAPTETCTIHTQAQLNNVEIETTSQGVKVPNVVGMTVSKAKIELEKLNLKVSTSGSDDDIVTKQSIKSGTLIDEGSTIVLTIKETEENNTNTSSGNVTGGNTTGNDVD